MQNRRQKMETLHTGAQTLHRKLKIQLQHKLFLTTLLTCFTPPKVDAVFLGCSPGHNIIGTEHLDVGLSIWLASMLNLATVWYKIESANKIRKMVEVCTV